MIDLMTDLPREKADLLDSPDWCGANALRDTTPTFLREGTAPTEALLTPRGGRLALQGPTAAFAGRQWVGTDADPAFPKWRPHLVARGGEDGILRPDRYHVTSDALGRPGSDEEER